MRVKIGDKIHDSNDEIVTLQLSTEERLQIGAMAGNMDLFNAFPAGTEAPVVERFGDAFRVAQQALALVTGAEPEDEDEETEEVIDDNEDDT